MYDVELPSIFNDDGSRNLFNAGQVIFAGLADLMGDVMDKVNLSSLVLLCMLDDSLNNQCFGVEYPDCAIFLEIDSKLEQWENHLPLEYQMDYDVNLLHDYTPIDLVILVRQRYTIHAWYLMSRLKLLIASCTGQGRSPQVPLHMRQSMERCISLSIQTIRFQTARYNAVTHNLHASIHSGDSWGFEGCFSLFEASVVLLTTLARYSWREKLKEADMLIQSALFTFNDWRSREPGKTGEIAARAIDVLITLQGQHWSEPSAPETNETQYSMSNVREDGTRHISRFPCIGTPGGCAGETVCLGPELGRVK